GFGRFGGGVVNTTLRSGTNDWHGSLFDYFRNRIFDANYFQNNFRGAPKDKHNQHQFGGAAGGPIRKDKDFLFVSFEGWRERIGFPALSSTPPVLLRDGQHFNDLGYKIYDPKTTHLCGSREPSSTCQGQTFIRDPFPNNVIPANRISPIGKAILSYFPAANAPGLSNNFIGSGNVGRYRYEQPVVRWDHTFGPNDKLNVVFTYQWGTEYRDSTGFGKPAGSGDVGSKRINHNYILDWTHVISPTMVLDVRGSYGRFFSFFPRYTDFDLTADSIGMTQMIHAPTVQKNTVPQVSVGGYTTLFALSGAGTVFSQNAFNQWNVTPSLTMTRGTHSLKTGFELNYVAAAALSPGWANGTFTFGKGLTQQFPSRDQGELDGSGVASLLLGAPTAGGIDVNDSAYRSRPYYALYVQDDWKVTPKLTLNLGLRWDVQVPWLERFNRATRGFDLTTKNPLSDQILANWATVKRNYDAANPNAKFKYPDPPSVLIGGYLFPGEGGQPQRLYDTDWTNIAPRFGLAWRFADKTVLRLGAGVFYQSPTQNGVVTGFNQRTNYNTSLDGLTPSAGLTGPYSLVNPFPDGLAPAIRSSLGLLTNVGNGVSFDPPGFKIPRTYQYSFGFEHELPSNIVLEVSFAGNYQIFATTGFNLNGLRLEDFNAGRLDNSYLNRNLPNPFFGILPRTSGFGANSTIAATNLLTPNPIFGGITNNLLQDGHYRSDALQVRLEKRAFGNRGTGVMTWGLSYTFAKAFEQNHRLNNFNALEPNIYEIDNTDKPHTFSFHGVWELPVGTNRRVKIGNPVANGVFGDWSFDWIFSYSSGYPVGWPNFENTCGNWHTNKQTELRWLNNDRTCYKQLPNFTLRTQLDRFSDIREPAATQLNVALAKVFVFTERYRLQFKSEAFNVTNTPIRPGPDTNPNSTTFGQLPKSQKNFPRVIQLAMKFYF
ncbi:MAG TPA: hypothetical protein VGV87_04015, partial [Blastocatellia bacterium]|nr:hypothetical protein [Blastocatellia bacterium]